MPRVSETTWNLLVNRDEMSSSFIESKAKTIIEQSVKNKDADDFLANHPGWETKSSNTKNTTFVKQKLPGDAFEDEVWTIFYKMGFKYLNICQENKKFAIQYSPENKLSKQIDVVAIDDDICLLIECKDSATYDAKRNFQRDINEVASFYTKVCSVIKTKFPNVQCKYVFATRNIILGDTDKARLKENDIIYFDYATILYYKALVEHLGSAAKYQLLGQVFAKEPIADGDVVIPAIKGEMGKCPYYSFLIEPEKLLKIAYVLHKTNANNDYEDLLPSYQRLIKKDRLADVRRFISEGNFFPNSIIVSIDTDNSLEFESLSEDDGLNVNMRIGKLHIPQVFGSVFIIDGQHRLYGYSDSTYDSNDTIPVVAFENLSNMEQLRLFMEINMNQKAIPPALQDILEIDVYYDSKDANLAQKALLGNIAKNLGEDKSSSLKGRIIIGEDAKTARCSLTIKNFKNAFKQTSFFNKLTKKGQVSKNGNGLFDKGSNVDTFNTIYPIILNFINMISEEFANEWNKDDNFFVKNNTIGCLIKILNDIINVGLEKDPDLLNNPNQILNKCKDHIDAMLLALGELSEEDRRTIVKEKGTKNLVTGYRLIQMHMHELDPTFTNADIENYYVEKYKNYNEYAKPEIIEIKKILLKNIYDIFNEDGWMRKHLSEQHENDLTSRVNAKNNANARNGKSIVTTEWDEMDFGDIRKMIDHPNNWVTYLKPMFSNWIENCNKDEATSLMTTIDKCSTNIKNGNKITGTEYNSIHKLYVGMMGAL